MGAAGFFGKLPSRGDFLRRGLPRGFAETWDDCMSRGIVASRAALGEGWLPAWMEAPIWYFALPAGMCGAEAVLGVWMPSTDAGGRYFPLTLAQLSPDWEAAGAWLASAETAGLAALQDDLDPDALVAAMAHPAAAALALPDLGAVHDGYALWWTEGSPFVPACCRVLGGLPDGADFTGMIHQSGACRSGTGASAEAVDGETTEDPTA